MTKSGLEEASQELSGIIEVIFELREHAITASQTLRDLSSRKALLTDAYTQWQADLLRSLDQMMPALQDIAESMISLPEKPRRALILLDEHGWYLDPDMPLPVLWELGKILEEGNITELETALGQFYRDKVTQIEKDLMDMFPHRSKILKQAFGAHRRKEYFLSTPVFLAQTDGICQEYIGIQLFRREKPAIPATASKNKPIPEDELRSALLHPLTKSLPNSASEKERKAELTSLNHNEILHGISLDYGTEVNSLKSISLLNYMATILTWETET